MLLLDGLRELALVGIGPVLLTRIQCDLQDSLVVGLIDGDVLLEELGPVAVLILHGLPQFEDLARAVPAVASIVSSFDPVGLLGGFGQQEY